MSAAVLLVAGYVIFAVLGVGFMYGDLVNPRHYSFPHLIERKTSARFCLLMLPFGPVLLVCGLLVRFVNGCPWRSPFVDAFKRETS